MNLYLIKCSGQGDTQLTLVDEETWNWVHSSWPWIGQNKIHGIDPNVPTNVLDRIKTAWAAYEDEPLEGIDITRGSWTNDRALMVPGAMVNDKASPTFYSTKDLFKFVKDNNIEIIDEYEGYIY